MLLNFIPRSPSIRVVSIVLVAVFLFPELGIPIHQQLNVRNGLFDIVGLADTNDVFRHTPAFVGGHVNLDLVVSTNVFDFGSPGTNDAVEEFVWDKDLLVDQSRVGDGMVVVGANVLDDLLRLLDVCWDVAGNANANRGFDVSDLRNWNIEKMKNGEQMNSCHISISYPSYCNCHSEDSVHDGYDEPLLYRTISRSIVLLRT